MSTAIPPTFETLRHRVHAALRAWHNLKNGHPESFLDDLAPTPAPPTSPSPPDGVARRYQTNAVLEQALQELAITDVDGAQILRDHFVNRKKTEQIAHQINRSEDAVNHLQRAAIQHLTKIIAAQARQNQDQHTYKLAAALPSPTYTSLFGITAVQAQLMAALATPAAPWLLVITGIGGIGKTTLADVLARQSLQQAVFDAVLWIRLKPQSETPTRQGPLLQTLIDALARALWPNTQILPAEQLNRVHQALKSRRYLVVVDNLELANETYQVLEQVAQLVNPSKFLLTSRYRPLGPSTVFIVTLNELPWEDAFALLQHQARISNQADFAEATPEQLAPVYQVVGGNPLALKLVMRLAAIEPLEYILAELRQTSRGATLQLYRHIYRKAWQALSTPAQKLLMSMPLIANVGGTRDHMRAISTLAETPFQNALQELISWSLLETRGNLWERRYGIHRLTEIFVLQEIIQWPEDRDESGINWLEVGS